MIPPPLRHRARSLTEQMDAADCDPEMLDRTYARFRIVNALVAGWRTTYTRHLRPVLSRDRPTTVLDIGSGGGDLSRGLVRWARRDGFDVRVTGIDPDPRAHAWARRRPPVPGASFRRATSRELVGEGRTFDLVISNHLLHHLDDEQLSDLLVDSQRLARVRAVHSDIRRSRWGYLLFAAGTAALHPVFRTSFIREDGLTSIRRSYTVPELRAVVPPVWRVTEQAPSRILLHHDADLLHDPDADPARLSWADRLPDPDHLGPS
ncbi:MAG: class I SAM-dependent methyltransferase [Brachybacterium tyrofermentans]|uniref:class I SAM-dependent methyltransferase n=1 Tax=Brachybacterium TaxID=43668 RepID=UPI000A1B006F|nr:Methyltransferase type 12 [Corynebacterium xerosis]